MEELIAAIVLMVLLIFQQFAKNRTGNNNVTRLEKENNKLAQQTSATVNKCSERTSKVMDSNMALMDAIYKHLEKDDVGHLSHRLDDTVQMLAKMGEHQNLCLRTLDGISSLTRSIADDLQKTDSRIVHEQIIGKVHSVESLVEDIKRIVISK